MSYPIEIKICSKNGWQTPAESQAYYGRYSRDGIAVHWWGDGTGASNHDNIVNYISNKAVNGTGSANYVLSDNKITLLVSPDNVAWCTFAANAYTISIEFQPTLGAEGYKKAGWLINELEGRYGKTLYLKGHNALVGGTVCPGTLDIGRMRAEADKWKSGGYNPPVVVPTPPVTPRVDISYSVLPTPITYKVNKNTNLWDFNTATWAGFKAVKPLNQNDIFTVYAIADNHSTKSHYGVTEYSYTRKITNGVNMADLDLVPDPVQPFPTPPEPPKPPVTPPAPVEPPVVDPDRNAVIAFLLGLVKSITEFLAKFKKG